MNMRLIAICTMAAMFLTTSAQKPEGVVKKASVAPIIGGEIDAVWAEALAYNISKPFQNEIPSLGAEGETTWKALWTYEGIYVLVEVADDVFYPNYFAEPVGQPYDYDICEIFFDCNVTLIDGAGPASDPGHHHVIPSFVDGSNDGTAIDYPMGEGVVYAYTVFDPEYVAEIFFPFDYLLDKDGEIVERTGQIGFDINVVDSDQDASLRNRAVWANDGTTGVHDESWNNMDECGIITLEGYKPPTLVDSIILTGGEITIDNGTLQIEAIILPDSAENKKLAWSIESVTGKASISQEGMVKGILDGIVKVKAISTDGSEVTDSALVTISNQHISLDDLNLIRNGNFEWFDKSGYPEEWIQILAREDRPPFVQDGYVVLDPSQDVRIFYEFQFGQQEYGCNMTSEYLFSFVAWADEVRPFTVDFEDPANSWIYYGTSDHKDSFAGQSFWEFDVTTEPTLYSFYVVFNNMLPNTVESLMFQLGESGVVTYLDSVRLVNLDDLPLMNDYNPVTSISVGTVGDATTVEKDGTLQMNAEVVHQDATLADYRWSIVPGTGAATIDADGVLTGTEAGSVTVVATARDGSNVTGVMEIEVTVSVASIKVTGEGNATTVVKNSSLQMAASVSPLDASVTEVDWSVAQGTGEASIDETGLLTGVEAGTVIVMAFAKDESGVFGALEVEVIENTGIDLSEPDILKVYPNPAVNELIVTLPARNCTVVIFNSLGTQMDQVIVPGTDYTFDISTYPEGVYLLKAGIQVRYFIKE